MDTLVHVVSTLWIYLRREHYLRMATEAEAQLATMANTASGPTLRRIEHKRHQIAADILRLSAPLTWASLRRSEVPLQTAHEHMAPETILRPVGEKSLVEVG
jgi:hypothetical protein